MTLRAPDRLASLIESLSERETLDELLDRKPGAAAMQSGDFSPQRAYLSVGANPVGKPLLERVCGVVRRTREEFR